MTKLEAENRAKKMGLSAWATEAIAVGKKSRMISLCCIGFVSLQLPLAEAESWEEAFYTLDQIIR